MPYVYMVECRDGSLYTGWSTDVVHRVKMHNAGKGARYTRSRRPVKLVYVEVCADKIEAMQKEYAIKHESRLEKRQRITQMDPHLIEVLQLEAGHSSGKPARTKKKCTKAAEDRPGPSAGNDGKAEKEPEAKKQAKKQAKNPDS